MFRLSIDAELVVEILCRNHAAFQLPDDLFSVLEYVCITLHFLVQCKTPKSFLVCNETDRNADSRRLSSVPVSVSAPQIVLIISSCIEPNHCVCQPKHLLSASHHREPRGPHCS